MYLCVYFLIYLYLYVKFTTLLNKKALPVAPVNLQKNIFKIFKFISYVLLSLLKLITKS